MTNAMGVVNMTNAMLKLGAGILAAVCLTTTAQAAAVSVYLDQSNADAALPDGINYLEVGISDGIGGVIDFTVQTLAPLLDLERSGDYGIQQFGFNFGSSPGSITDLVLPTGWDASPGYERDFDKFGFGEFDVVLHTVNDNRADPLMFSIDVENDSIESYLTELSVGNAEHGNVLFAAHVAAFTAEYEMADQLATVNAAKFGGATVVPIPPTSVLMLSGLLAVGGMASRRQKSDS